MPRHRYGHGDGLFCTSLVLHLQLSLLVDSFSILNVFASSLYEVECSFYGYPPFLTELSMGSSNEVSGSAANLLHVYNMGQAYSS